MGSQEDVLVNLWHFFVYDGQKTRLAVTGCIGEQLHCSTHLAPANLQLIALPACSMFIPSHSRTRVQN